MPLADPALPHIRLECLHFVLALLAADGLQAAPNRSFIQSDANVCYWRSGRSKRLLCRCNKQQTHPTQPPMIENEIVQSELQGLVGGDARKAVLCDIRGRVINPAPLTI
jgi:hypothetical protein